MAIYLTYNMDGEDQLLATGVDLMLQKDIFHSDSTHARNLLVVCFCHYFPFVINVYL